MDHFLSWNFGLYNQIWLNVRNPWAEVKSPPPPPPPPPSRKEMLVLHVHMVNSIVVPLLETLK